MIKICETFLLKYVLSTFIFVKDWGITPWVCLAWTQNTYTLYMAFHLRKKKKSKYITFILTLPKTVENLSLIHSFIFKQFMIQSNMNGMPSFNFNSFLITNPHTCWASYFLSSMMLYFLSFPLFFFFFSFSFLASFPCVLVPPTRDATRESNEETQGERDVRL